MQSCIGMSSHAHTVLAHELDNTIEKNIWGAMKLTVGITASVFLSYLPVKFGIAHQYNSMGEMRQDPNHRYLIAPFFYYAVRPFVLLTINGYQDINFVKITRAEAQKYLQLQTQQKLPF
ncbi:hypothetical protein BH09DEP1_BH09DEP1_5350 [soil metagenome]